MERKYVNPHQSKAPRPRGDKSHRWKGGQFIDTDGYRKIRVENHPRKRNYNGVVYIAEHILVMEKHLGRYLEKDEVVHHINRNRLDNRIENLQVMTHREHSKLHNTKNMSDRVCLICFKNTSVYRKWFLHLDTKKKWICRTCYQRLKWQKKYSKRV